MGVVASNAPDGVRGLEPWWKATLAGESGIRRLARFAPSSFSLQYAGEVEGFAPEDSVDAHLLTQTDSWSQMGVDRVFRREALNFTCVLEGEAGWIEAGQ